MENASLENHPVIVSSVGDFKRDADALCRARYAKCILAAVNRSCDDEYFSKLIRVRRFKPGFSDIQARGLFLPGSTRESPFFWMGYDNLIVQPINAQ